MIGQVDDDRVAHVEPALDRLEQAADRGVHEADRSVVQRLEGPPIVVGEARQRPPEGAQMRRQRRIVHVAADRRRHGVGRVRGAEARRGIEGVVRILVADPQHQRSLAGVGLDGGDRPVGDPSRLMGFLGQRRIVSIAPVAGRADLMRLDELLAATGDLLAQIALPPPVGVVGRQVEERADQVARVVGIVLDGPVEIGADLGILAVFDRLEAIEGCLGDALVVRGDVQLADGVRAVAMGLERFGHGRQAVREGVAVAHQAVARALAARQDRGARRAADGVVGQAVVELHTLAGQPVERRGAADRAAIAADRVGTVLVGADDDDVGMAGLGGHGGRQWRGVRGSSVARVACRTTGGECHLQCCCPAFCPGFPLDAAGMTAYP